MDADIKGFFDSIDREQMLRFVEHRIGGWRLARLIGKWLCAGVMEGGRQVDTGRGGLCGGGLRAPPPPGGSLRNCKERFAARYGLELHQDKTLGYLSLERMRTETDGREERGGRRRSTFWDSRIIVGRVGSRWGASR